ncbi:unnamed protein product [Symbiodinium natans]|uniref:C3H1-type domain-containing protein n=1 Tax=Symbiodinium natans TaxID=878477 RepID=A0A812KWM7_9DINO|nr:unnamed protein product [Symbiodinium natans]
MEWAMRTAMVTGENTLQGILRSFPPPGVQPEVSLGLVLQPDASCEVQAEQGETNFLDNPGSHGHPLLCRKPCVYILKNAMSHVGHMGSSCKFCHYTDHGNHSKPDRSQRSVLQRLTPGQLVGFMIPHLRRKLGEVAQTEAAIELLELMEARIQEPPILLRRKERQHLERGLRNLTIASMISHLGFPEADESFEHLRLEVRLMAPLHHDVRGVCRSGPTHPEALYRL